MVCPSHIPIATARTVQPGALHTLRCLRQRPLDCRLAVQPGSTQIPFPPCRKQSPALYAFVVHVSTWQTPFPPCFPQRCLACERGKHHQAAERTSAVTQSRNTEQQRPAASRGRWWGAPPAFCFFALRRGVARVECLISNRPERLCCSLRQNTHLWHRA